MKFSNLFSNGNAQMPIERGGGRGRGQGGSRGQGGNGWDNAPTPFERGGEWRGGGRGNAPMPFEGGEWRGSGNGWGNVPIPFEGGGRGNGWGRGNVPMPFEGRGGRGRGGGGGERGYSPMPFERQFGTNIINLPEPESNESGLMTKKQKLNSSRSLTMAPAVAASARSLTMAPAVAASEKETAVTSTSSLTVSPTDQTALALPGGTSSSANSEPKVILHAKNVPCSWDEKGVRELLERSGTGDVIYCYRRNDNDDWVAVMHHTCAIRACEAINGKIDGLNGWKIAIEIDEPTPTTLPTTSVSIRALTPSGATPLGVEESPSSAARTPSKTVENILDDEMSIYSNESHESIQSNSDPYLWNSNDPVRFHAKLYYPHWKQSVRDGGKIDELSEDQAIALFEGNCFFCDKEHEPGNNFVNSIDRIHSWAAVYAPWNCITACSECNSMKLWLEHVEFANIISQWNEEGILSRLITMCDIKSIEDLDELAALDSDGSCVKIPGRGMSDMRKGLELLMENPRTREIVQQKVLSPCAYCDQNIAWGIDRLDSNESYIVSLLHDRLLPCCTACNIFKGSNVFKNVLIQARRIHMHIKSEKWENKARSPSEEHAKNLMECPDSLLTTLTFGHENRAPVRTEIDDETIVFPSINTAKTFKFSANFEDGLITKSASIPEYRSFLKSALSKDARKAFGINLDDIKIDDDMLGVLTEMEAMAEHLFNLQSDVKNKLPSTRRKPHHMSFKGTSFSSNSKNEASQDSDSDSDSDSESDDDFLKGLFEQDSSQKRLLPHNPGAGTLAARVKKRCADAELEYKLSDFYVQSLHDTPFRDKKRSTRYCRVLYQDDGEWKQCQKCSHSNREHLCKNHFTILVGLDDSEDADWRL